ncbi:MULTISPECIES: acetyl-CoA C-acetyltransferase [Paraclostridium]|uniref:Acetyl-CoA acetyltransferase n=1 Tax=Paraclostridium benzoelyticum TaxID=1629550 RepID=A0A0M3DJ63_9FIRM|nr:MULTISPECIES: acetyl-CoA C-acetyltransferase [Paraclostridium]KKY02620.1 acetyl-CoA acetyltransferase [Paraclostridium benzoelyticum]MCU9815163.1 acetyl-CoA C-acetyltransferase [Paraclostridium sp. AKS73]OXX85138.1 acetyl-CoA acetyltransferase [Paraclostridium benzoelyticum]
MSKVYIVDAKRSPIGKFLGELSTVPPSQLAGQVIKSIIETNNLNARNVDEVILGNVLPAGQGQGIARQASIHANIPFEVPAYSVNIICGSGMKTVMTAYSQIKSGIGDLILAGGVEVMSQAPYVTETIIRTGSKMGSMSLKDSLVADGLTDAFNNYHMGITAENIAQKYSITRHMQDEFAFKSQQKAINAIDNGRFEDEIVPIEVKTRKGSVIVDTDEYPNRNTSLEAISKLRPAFKKDGTVTAGNASGINDGASIVLVASEKAVKEYGLKPIAELISVGQGGVDPSVMGLGPVPAVKDALERANMKLEEIDLIELNEAFAAQSLGVIEALKENHSVDDDWFEERTNVNGGAIAIGHPLGASGARIITTLLHEMKKRELKHGLASLCIGGGMGTCVIVKLIM